MAQRHTPDPEPLPVIRTCCNCRHFEVRGQGHEVPNLADTRFLASHCRKLGWTVREHYLFPEPGRTNGVLEIHAPKPCPHWRELIGPHPNPE